jgi:HD-GYP domain-containing protein (c-di-GMP phosphodiesterase class II)
LTCLDFNDFILALSSTLDLSLVSNKIDCNHSKRICYISVKLSETLNFSNKETYNTALLLLLYNTKYNYRDCIKDLYCRTENFTTPDFSSEKYLLIEDMLKLAYFADTHFDLTRGNKALGNYIVSFMKQPYNTEFNPLLVHAFSQIAEDDNFWHDIIHSSINSRLQYVLNKLNSRNLTIEINKIVQVLNSIIGPDSLTGMHSAGLAKKVEFMTDYFSIEGKEKYMLTLSAKLHDLGKIAIPSDILNKPSKLTEDEFQIIKTHPIYTRYILSHIKGLEAVTEWASNHHEKLNGSGYPHGFTNKDLDFNSKLIACVDIYQALTERRPYRRQLTHKEALAIMEKMYMCGEIDGDILRGVSLAFA